MESTILQLTDERVREIYEEEQTRKSLAIRITTHPELVIYTVHKMKKEGTHTPDELNALEIYAKIAQEVIDERPSVFKWMKRCVKRFFR
jgi:hypothetical protein